MTAASRPNNGTMPLRKAPHHAARAVLPTSEYGLAIGRIAACRNGPVIVDGKDAQPMPSERPIIILYTEAAEISEEVLSAMPAAGYLPVKVSDPGAVRVLEIPTALRTPTWTRSRWRRSYQSRRMAAPQHRASGAIWQNSCWKQRNSPMPSDTAREAAIEAAVAAFKATPRSKPVEAAVRNAIAAYEAAFRHSVMEK